MTLRGLARLLLPAWVALAPQLRAAPGDEVVVVYNRRMAPDSQQVAEHYAERRGVAAERVIGLTLPVTEIITRAEFREQLQKPLVAELEARHLLEFKEEFVPANRSQPGEVRRAPVRAKLRYLVLCYGVPLRIQRDEKLVEPGADKLAPEMRRNEAAVDSELAVLPRLEAGMRLAGPAGNLFFSNTNAAVLQATNGILLVARLDGPSVAVARELVDKALAAETNGLWGRAYFDLRRLTNGGYELGDDWLRQAAKVVRRRGFETVVDEKPETFPAAFPLSQVAIYAGWYDWHVSGPFARPQVEFMPGAIAYHLQSFSAMTLRATNVAWVGPLLAKGATVSFGCVDEPYLQFTPDLGVFFSALILSGYTYGEAAYVAQPALSWQTTVVGDPLYRPFGRKAREIHEDLERRQSADLEWSHLGVVNLNLATGLPPEQAIGYLDHLPLTRQSAILRQKVGDLYLDLGKLLDGAEEYRQALQLKPSRQQRVHLQLTLSRLLVLLDREAEACDLYAQFLQDNKDYPDLPGICQKLLPLAKKLGRAELVALAERELSRAAPAGAAPANKP